MVGPNVTLREDSRNANGGFWVMRISKNDSLEAWKELVLAAIGEQFTGHLEDQDDITGVSLSIRPYDNLLQGDLVLLSMLVWNSNAANSKPIFDRVQQLLNCPLNKPFYRGFLPTNPQHTESTRISRTS